MNDFLRWELIGKGAERQCFLLPDGNQRCLKVSLISKSKQSRREINYFKFLKKRNIPFTLIPDFYRVIKTDTYLGIEQEVILNSDGTFCHNVEKHLQYCCHSQADEIKLMASMNALKSYLLKYNVIPCDLVLSNILIKKNGSRWESYLIDGFGSPQIIPIHNYIPFLGRRKIERKWSLFIEERVKPLLKYT